MCVSCFPLFSSHISRIVRDSRDCSVGPMIKSGAYLAQMHFAGIIANTPCCTVDSVLKRLQASGIEFCRSSVQEYMKAEHWPAKQVICGTIHASLPFFFYFVALPQVKNQHLSALYKRRRLEWSHRCWSALEKRRGRIQGTLLQTHITRSFHATLRTVSSHSANDLHDVLCRAISRISIAISPVSGSFRCPLVCVSVPSVGMSPRDNFS